MSAAWKDEADDLPNFLGPNAAETSTTRKPAHAAATVASKVSPR